MRVNPHFIDKEQAIKSIGLSPRNRKAVAAAHKCGCLHSSLPTSIGRHVEGVNGIHRKVDAELIAIDSKTKANANLLNPHYECPWQAFKDPLWVEVRHFLDLKEIPGTTNINDSTNNAVYDAVLFYLHCHNSIDNYVAGEEARKREEEYNNQKNAGNKK